MTAGSGLVNGDDGYDAGEADKWPRLQLVLLDEAWVRARASPVLDALRFFDVSLCALHFDGAEFTLPRDLVPGDARRSALPRFAASTILGRWRDLATPAWRARKPLMSLPMAAQVKASLIKMAKEWEERGLGGFGGFGGEDGDEDGGGGDGEGPAGPDPSDKNVERLLGKLEEVLKRRVAKYAARGFKVAVTPQEEERLLALVKARTG
jgi:hypothetical protein